MDQNGTGCALRGRYFNERGPIMRGLATIILGSALLAGCAGMSEDECLTANWETVGYIDGAEGRTGNYINRHRESCAKHGVSPNLAQYLKGREDGLMSYCEPVNAYRVGKRGRDYLGVCPPRGEDLFLAAYNDGRELYALQISLKTLHAEIHDIEGRLVEIDDKLAVKQRVATNNPDRVKRANAASAIERLAEEKGELQIVLDDLALESEDLDYEIVRYERAMTRRYGS